MRFHRFLSTPGSPLHKIEETSTASLPHSRGGPDTWENLVWSSKDVNTRKGNRLPHEAGLKLLSVPRAPKELPVTTLMSQRARRRRMEAVPE
jgi:Restriction endonuclease